MTEQGDLPGQTFRFQYDTYDPEVEAEKIRRALAERRYVIIFDDGVYVPPPSDESDSPEIAT